LTETGGGATRTIGPEERRQLASAGRLSENMEAKIVNPETGEALGLGQRGELWLRGPTVMKGSDHGLKMIFFLKYIKIIL
jgi:long-subunit acyl-CoA synthetase (AMP-forming)